VRSDTRTSPFHRTRLLGPLLLAACTAVAAVSATAAETKTAPPAQSNELLAFPGALGWAAHTPGGRGGQVIRVTTLADKGPASFLEALETKGPRIIVFEVGGVIDLRGEEIEITEPFLTIAGQTAPAPGITLIRAGVNIRAHDVIIQHIHVRTGTAGMAKRTFHTERCCVVHVGRRG
jgi:hypothetical protein